MIRKTLTIFSLIGLLLSVGLWGVSYGNCGYGTGVELWLLTYGRLIYFEFLHDPPEGFWWGHITPSSSQWLPGIGHAESGSLWFSLPLWIPTLLFAAYPAYRLLPFHRRRKRKKLGLCVKCGFDLRASKDRCPECGLPLENRRSDNNCRHGAGSTK